MDEQPIDALNVIPFVDIMLVLLTIVLTTASFIATGRIPVALPRASQAQVEKHEDKKVDITASGEFYFDGEPVSAEDFERQAKELPTGTSFLIRADRNVVFQKFVDVADVLERSGFTKVAVQVRSTSK